MLDTTEFEARLRRLEAALDASKPRGSTNQINAARYLGISEETLRRLAETGEGPPRSRRGARGWSYTFADLDRFIAERLEK